MTEEILAIHEREHKVENTPPLKKEHVTETGGPERTNTIQEEIIWGVGPEALYQIIIAEYKTEPDSMKKDLIRLFTKNYIAKHNTYNNREEFFWAKHHKKSVDD